MNELNGMKNNAEMRTFIAIAIISALGVTSRSLLAPVEVRFLETLTSNTTLIGARYSILALFFGIFSLIIGRASSKYGKKPFLIIGAVLAAIYPLLFAASTSIYQYIAFTIVAAFGGAALEPLLSSIIQDTLKKNGARGKYIGFYYALSAIMGSAGAYIGGALADAYGLKAPYYAVAAVEMIAAILAIRFILRFEKKKVHPLERQDIEKREILFSLKYILKDSALVFHLILQTAFDFYGSMKNIVYPIAIFAVAKSNTATGSVFAAMGIVAMFVLPAAGHYIDKKGYFSGAKIGYLILGISSLALAFSDNLPMFFLFASLFAVGEAIKGPMTGVIEIKRIKNSHRTELMGFYNAHSSFISIISPLFAGALLAFMPPSKVLLIYSVFLWLGLFAGLIALKKK
ncbi:Multidrug resistance protein MdtH [uncultured archaeon]|nr:Multidrug resistance protein MdtH [uncultured archaeon]